MVSDARFPFWALATMIASWILFKSSAELSFFKRLTSLGKSFGVAIDESAVKAADFTSELLLEVAVKTTSI